MFKHCSLHKRVRRSFAKKVKVFVWELATVISIPIEHDDLYVTLPESVFDHNDC